MKKSLISITIALTLLLTSCNVPGAGDTTVPNETDGPGITSGAIVTTAPPVTSEASHSLNELRDMIGEFKKTGDHRSIYETALKLIELDPADTDSYILAINALVAMSNLNRDEINRLLSLGVDNAGDVQALSEWAKHYQPECSVSMPFIPDCTSPDEINTVGISTGNMTNAAKYNGWWVGGLLTWQGDWVYFTRPDEDFAMYKMRSDTSEYQSIGEEHGYCVNVIGDWIYYVNYYDENKAYKIHTDGSEKTKLTDDDCSFLSVSGEWMFYHNGNDNGCLYKLKTDGSGKTKLVDKTVMFACVADGYVYYTEKSMDSSLYRISIDGGNPEVYIGLGTAFIQTYSIWNDWIYFFDANEPYSVRRVRTDGTDCEVPMPFHQSISTLNISEGKLFCSFWYDKHYEEDGFYIGEEIVVFDVETLEKLYHIPADTEPICTGPDGWIYYLKHSENLAWYAMDKDGREYKVE